MKNVVSFALAAATLAGAPLAAQQAAAPAQPWSPQDPVLQRIWDEGTSRSQLEPLAHVLLDSIGPRLTGTPGMEAGQDWVVRTYASWGVTAAKERYGTWTGWQRGITHIDMLSPRVRSLEGTLLAWSGGTRGPVTGEVIALPEVADSAAFRAWLPNARGKFVLVGFPQLSCRPDTNWVAWGRPETVARYRADRQAAMQAWQRRVTATGVSARALPGVLQEAGAAGILSNNFSQGWGVDKIFSARTRQIPSLDIGCEDYSMLYRLTASGRAPTIRVNAEGTFTGDAVPATNAVARIRGSQKPNEFIVLSAHFDSWDGSQGATDNGTGTLVMMEAMRILRAVYPNPRRSIVVGHWGGEEQGLIGSRAFAADNPDVVNGLHVLFNQDNGTGRIQNVSMQGFTATEPYFRRWFGQMPQSLVGEIRLDAPGSPGGGGSDHAAFVCHGAPAFMLGSLSWDYGTYTWHTNRDSYDKIAFDDVRSNAILVAMLVYLADQESDKLPRTQRTEFPVNPNTGQRGAWPTCAEPQRDADAYQRF